MKRYVLADVTELVLKPAGNDRWSYFTVDAVMFDGMVKRQPAVNTSAQAERRRDDWFPNAVVTVAA